MHKVVQIQDSYNIFSVIPLVESREGGVYTNFIPILCEVERLPIVWPSAIQCDSPNGV